MKPPAPVERLASSVVVGVSKERPIEPNSSELSDRLRTAPRDGLKALISRSPVSSGSPALVLSSQPHLPLFLQFSEQQSALSKHFTFLPPQPGVGADVGSCVGTMHSHSNGVGLLVGSIVGDAVGLNNSTIVANTTAL